MSSNQNNTAAAEEDVKDLKEVDEQKMKAMYPHELELQDAGNSLFAQKRLQNKIKFFDSGDYQMAKQKPDGYTPVFLTTGDTIPTPETVSERKCYYSNIPYQG